jgi:hypothetical protein
MTIYLLDEPYTMLQSNWPYKLIYWTGLTSFAYWYGQKNCNPVNFGRQHMPPLFFMKALHVKKHSFRPKLPKGDGKTSPYFSKGDGIGRSFQPCLVRS